MFSLISLNLLPEDLISVALLTPLIGILGILLFRKFKNLRELVTLFSSSFLFVLVLNIYDLVNSGEFPSLVLFEIFPSLRIGFTVEPLGIIFGLVASGLWIINSVYSIGYMRANSESNQTRFYICFALAIFSALGIAFSSNLLTFFLFYEILTICTYPLVTHSGSSVAKTGGRIYLTFLLGTSICFLLLGIISVWDIAGTLDFTLGGVIPSNYGSLEISILLVLFVFGIGKAALMPFHFWLPAAMVAPTPVSALLHAVAVVKAGVFGIIKVILYIFGTETLSVTFGANLISFLACSSIVIASVVALKADNLKKRLAYSTVSQLSYVILAISILNPLAVVAAVFHLVAHAFGKITLFFAAGSLYTTLHKTEVSELNGVGKQMPITMIAFSIGVLTMIGLPFTGGFISKWYLLSGAIIEKYWFILIVILISTLLNVAYFIPIIYRAFFLSPITEEVLSEELDSKQSYDHIRYKFNFEAPASILVALITTSMCSIFLFLFPETIVKMALQLNGA